MCVCVCVRVCVCVFVFEYVCVCGGGGGGEAAHAHLRECISVYESVSVRLLLAYAHFEELFTLFPRACTLTLWVNLLAAHLTNI